MGVRHSLIIGLLALIGATLAWVYWDALIGHAGTRLAGLALERVPESGVSNPVTAVLLNFRAYDTLLELAVLLAAILGIWSSGPEARGFLPAGPVLGALTSWVVPLLILAAGYLLWVGGHAPGGAFQAGALLGAAGVVLRLSGEPSAGLPPLPWLRVGIGLGVLIFTLTGLALMALGQGFLTYPAASAKWLILMIETAATLSIGATLAAAYLAGEPVPARSTTQQPGGTRP
ncbi:MAG: MnhB domain-containing protein [Chromatiaceae bacterium]|jgi:multisubunit Na+/H+ antiporter MnhB subunit|nr:MnhB domain-containing protein [Chromatiaceae bacterium]